MAGGLLTGLQTGLTTGLLTGLGTSLYSAGRSFPASAAQWASAFPSITAPTAIYTCQESSGDLIDRIGSVDLSSSGTVTYQRPGDPLGRKAVRFTGSSYFAAASSTSFDIDETQDLTIWWRVSVPDNGATQVTIGGKRGGAGSPGYAVNILATTGKASAIIDGGTPIATEVGDDDIANSSWYDICFSLNRTSELIYLFVNESDSPSPADTSSVTTPANSGNYSLGQIAGITNVQAGTLLSYNAIWVDTAITYSEWLVLIGA